MLRAEELAAIEAQMEQQHRRDREAVEWLKHRFLQNGHTNGHTPVSSAAPLAHDDQDDFDESTVTIRSQVAELFQKHPERKWTVGAIADQLKANGVKIQAQRPQSTLGPILKRLQQRGHIRVIRRGHGRIPSTYRLFTKQDDNSGESAQSTPKPRPSALRVAAFLKENGPLSRGELAEKSGIAAGTISNALTRKDLFRQREDQRWEAL